MSVQVLNGMDDHTLNTLKLSGAALCTAGQVCKLLSTGEITPVSAATDKPFGVFLNTVTASDKTYLGKGNEVPIAIKGAVLRSTEFAAGNKPTVASQVWFGADAKPHGNVSGASLHGVGMCIAIQDSTSFDFIVDFDAAADL